jgi:EmrB/QacA subfamily drug resistance transporter
VKKTDQTTLQGKDGAMKRSTLLVAVLASFMAPFIISGVNVALPSIGRELHLNAVLLGWVTMSAVLVSAMLLVPVSRFADIYGHKKIFLSGTFIILGSSVLAILSRSPVLLIISRAVQGIGTAMIFGTAMTIVLSVFPLEERGKTLGVTVASTYSGLSLGPFLGGFLTDHFGWRSIFMANIPICLAIISIIILKLRKEWADAAGERFDFVGSFLYGLSIFLVMYGFSSLPGLLGFALILCGALLVFIFIKWAGITKSPVLNMSLFKGNKAFAFSSLAALIHYSSINAVTFLMSLYLQYIQGMSAQRAGIILVSQPLMQAVFSPLAGKLSDKVEPRIVASTGMAMMVVNLAIFSFLSASTSIYLIIANFIVLGFGYALFSSPNTNAAMSSVDKRMFGVASGSLGTARSIGQVFSMGISMVAFAVFLGKESINPSNYPVLLRSIKVLFTVFTFLSLIGVAVSLNRGNIRKKGNIFPCTDPGSPHGHEKSSM